MNLPVELDRTEGAEWDDLIRRHVMSWGDGSNGDFSPSTDLSHARLTIFVLVNQYRMLQEQVERMDRKARHGCYDMKCKECDK